MRTIGWGALWGLGVFLTPFAAVSAVGILFSPASIGYLLFSLPVVAASGAVVGALGGALAAAVAPLARRGGDTTRALLRCAALYFAVLTTVAVALALLVVPAEATPSPLPAIPVVAVVATALATWGFARDRRAVARSSEGLAPRPGGGPPA